MRDATLAVFKRQEAEGGPLRRGETSAAGEAGEEELLWGKGEGMEVGMGGEGGGGRQGVGVP